MLILYCYIESDEACHLQSDSFSKNGDSDMSGKLEWSACPPSVSVETEHLNELVYCLAGSGEVSFSSSHLPTTVSKIPGNKGNFQTLAERNCRRSGAWSGRIMSVCCICRLIFSGCSKTRRSSSCYRFYRCGATMGLFISLSSVCLLLYTLLKSMIAPRPVASARQSAEVLTPLVPGVNIPWSHIVYIIIGYGISTFIHELGHALALATVGVAIDCMGWFIMCGLPGAYIKCSTSSIQSLRPHKQLHVFFAGVWHNALLTLGICSLLYVWQWASYIPGLLFRSGDGVTIISVEGAQKELTKGIFGLQSGDLIVSLSDRHINSVVDYVNALTYIYKKRLPILQAQFDSLCPSKYPCYRPKCWTVDSRVASRSCCKFRSLQCCGFTPRTTVTAALLNGFHIVFIFLTLFNL